MRLSAGKWFHIQTLETSHEAWKEVEKNIEPLKEGCSMLTLQPTCPQVSTCSGRFGDTFRIERQRRCQKPDHASIVESGLRRVLTRPAQAQMCTVQGRANMHVSVSRLCRINGKVSIGQSENHLRPDYCTVTWVVPESAVTLVVLGEHYYIVFHRIVEAMPS